MTSRLQSQLKALDLREILSHYQEEAERAVRERLTYEA
ncbi:hypothetical protein DSTSK_24610 [Desulforhabdus sp. TSK]|nr:hypothetical protein DSTSK_24610 [Desulforhabdus sp. TSK]